jgi:hypothetical protein
MLILTPITYADIVSGRQGETRYQPCSGVWEEVAPQSQPEPKPEPAKHPLAYPFCLFGTYYSPTLAEADTIDHFNFSPCRLFLVPVPRKSKRPRKYGIGTHHMALMAEVEPVSLSKVRKIEKLNDDNYSTWLLDMENVLDDLKLWDELDSDK